MRYFINPRTGAATAPSRRKRRRRKVRAASSRPTASRSRRRKRRVTKGANREVSNMAKKRSKRRRSARRSVVRARGNPRRSGRMRRARMNPPQIVQGIMEGAKGAAAVLVGKVATNTLARMIPYGAGSPAVDIAKRVAVAVVLGEVGKRVNMIGRDTAQLLVIGGLLSPMETAVRALNVPLVTQGLSGDDDVMLALLAPGNIGSYPQMGAYPQLGGSGSQGTDDLGIDATVAGWT